MFGMNVKEYERKKARVNLFKDTPAAAVFNVGNKNCCRSMPLVDSPYVLLA